VRTVFETILVPTDGSETARGALEHAVDLAGRFDATVRVLHAADELTVGQLPLGKDVRHQWGELLVEEAAEVVEDAGIDAEETVEVGAPYEIILEHAAECDLVVMGSHGRTGLERYLLGSIPEKVVRLADQPVVTVRAEEGNPPRYPYDDVLIPTDGSEGALEAVELGVSVAAAHDATVHAVSVVDERAMDARVGPGTEQLEDPLTERARRAVQSVEAAAANTDVGAMRTEVRSGTPHREIMDALEENAADLVVMGTHGRSGLERYLLGSVAERVLRTSPVPVMTVRRSADD
jgi:nucleotide-binding universal stress UspA family protein